MHQVRGPRANKGRMGKNLYLNTLYQRQKENSRSLKTSNKQKRAAYLKKLDYNAEEVKTSTEETWCSRL